MASKATVKRQKSAEKVVAAGRTHKTMIAREMAKTYGEEVIPGVELLLDKVVKDLDLKAKEMIQRDDAHEAELRDDSGIREARDVTSEALHTQLVTTREQLNTICGEDYVARIGYKGMTPDDPVEVARLGKVVVSNLGEIKAPPPLIPGYEFNSGIWQEPIVGLLNQLETSVTEVAKEEREAEATLTTKRSAIDAYDSAFSSTANLLSALLRIAGEKDLAKRVRPSTRRVGQTMEIAKQPTPDKA